MASLWQRSVLWEVRLACRCWRRRQRTLHKSWRTTTCTETGQSVRRWWRWSRKLRRDDVEWPGFSRRIRSKHLLMIKLYEMQHGTSAGGRKKGGCGTDAPMFPVLVATCSSGYISVQGNGGVTMCKHIWKPFVHLTAMSCASCRLTSSMIRLLGTWPALSIRLPGSDILTVAMSLVSWRAPRVSRGLAHDSTGGLPGGQQGMEDHGYYVRQKFQRGYSQWRSLSNNRLSWETDCSASSCWLSFTCYA